MNASHKYSIIYRLFIKGYLLLLQGQKSFPIYALTHTHTHKKQAHLYKFIHESKIKNKTHQFVVAALEGERLEHKGRKGATIFQADTKTFFLECLFKLI